ncbi:hypothetical protein GCM10020331_085430 [Ectobacillus funiculus]
MNNYYMKELQDYVTLFSPKLRQKKQHITVHRIFFDESHIIEVNGSKKTLKVKGDVYQLDADISWSDVKKNVGLRIRESTDKTRHIDVGLFIKDNFFLC